MQRLKKPEWIYILCNRSLWTTDTFNLNFIWMSMKITQISFSFSFSYSQIDCHDSGTESDGDLDTEDFHDRDIELSKWNDSDPIIVFNLLVCVRMNIIFISFCAPAFGMSCCLSNHFLEYEKTHAITLILMPCWFLMIYRSTGVMRIEYNFLFSLPLVTFLFKFQFFVLKSSALMRSHNDWMSDSGVFGE